MIIRRDQLEAISARIELTFLNELYSRLADSGTINEKRNLSIFDLERLVNHALGAGIKTKNLIYEFCRLGITNQSLLHKPFSDGVKNILYSTGTASNKIRVLTIYFEKGFH